MRYLVFVLALCCVVSGQTRRRAVIPSHPNDPINQIAVTFYGKLKDISKSEMTIETEDQPTLVIGRSHKTKFLKDGKDVKPDSIPVGTAVSVDVKKDPDLKPLALTVIVEPPAPKQEK
jgi:hypothetical protein